MRLPAAGTLFIAVMAIAALSQAGEAAAEPRIVAESVQLDYPAQLHFRVTAQSEAPITEVTLRYRLRASGIASFARPRDFTPGVSVNATVTIDVNTSSGFVPVGNTFDYYWEITDESGAVLTTEPQEYLLLPPDQDWQTREGGIITVYYPGGAGLEGLVEQFLVAARETNERMGGLLGQPLQNPPALGVLFASRSDMDIATTGSRLRGTACGVRVSDSTIYLSPEPCGTFDQTDTLRHEFTHILVGENAGPVVPLWLNEGTAVTGQVQADTAYTRPFEAAVRTNRLYSFIEMQRSQNPSTRVELFYGQAYAMVQFLLAVGGEEKYAEYFAELKAGERYDVALEAVYGFDLAGFEEEFRTALGLPASAATATPGQAQTPGAEPTAAPTRVVAGESGEGDGVGSVTIGIILGAVILGLLGVLMYLWLLLRARGARSGASGGDAGNPLPPG